MVRERVDRRPEHEAVADQDPEEPGGVEPERRAVGGLVVPEGVAPNWTQRPQIGHNAGLKEGSISGRQAQHGHQARARAPEQAARANTGECSVALS